MELLYKIELPISTVSEANFRKQHWSKKHARSKKQKDALDLLFPRPQRDYLRSTQPYPHTTLIRSSPRELDSDNLVSAFKSIRDWISDMLRPGLAPGRADGNGLLTFSYDQVKGKQGIIIEFYKKDFYGKTD